MLNKIRDFFSAETVESTRSQLQARHEQLTVDLAIVEATIEEIILDAETGNAEAAAELARLQQQRSELRLLLENVALALDAAARKAEAAEIRAAEEERATKVAQLHQALSARLEWAADAEKLMRQLATVLAEMQDRAQEVERLRKVLKHPKGWSVAAYERPFDRAELTCRLSQFAAGIGLLQWFDNRFLSQICTPVMNIPPADRLAGTPPLVAGEEAAHARILAAILPQDAPAELEPMAAAVR